MNDKAVKYVAEIGEKVMNRDTKESAVVDALASNSAGNWYYVTTVNGLAIGWWHETDLNAIPKSVPPTTARGKGSKGSKAAA